MNAAALTWAPAIFLAIGIAAVSSAGSQRSIPLEAPLATAVPMELSGNSGIDVEVSEEEQAVAGMSDYVMRVYAPGDPTNEFSVYVGYYESQTMGKTIHSPKNCLPGAGWEALTSTVATIATVSGAVAVNRYLLQNDDGQQALVLYWYQGRGRVEANEYRVKYDLLRDAALHGRSDEALVRVIVPVTTDEEAAFERASGIAADLVPIVYDALPA